MDEQLQRRLEELRKQLDEQKKKHGGTRRRHHKYQEAPSRKFQIAGRKKTHRRKH